MSGWKRLLAIGVTSGLLSLMVLPAAAQDEAAEAAEQARAAERQAEVAARSAEHAREVEVQMREAEERLAEAAARVAELSRSRLPQVIRAGHLQGMHPVMGITIGADDGGGPVEGVIVNGVTPGSAAADAGLRAGDVITAVNGENLGADKSEDANRKLLDFMDGIAEGDTLDVEYLRDGRAATVEVRPRIMPVQAFGFASVEPAFGFHASPDLPIAPGAPGYFNVFVGGGSWGDMEMVSLTEDLGRYFGTDEGLLVVRAPGDDKLKLRDGDVIQSIDGREPTSVSHAMRILGSYQAGETLEIEIMRDRKRQTVSVEMPDNRQSAAGEFHFSLPRMIEPVPPELVGPE